MIKDSCKNQPDNISVLHVSINCNNLLVQSIGYNVGYKAKVEVGKRATILVIRLQNKCLGNTLEPIY